MNIKRGHENGYSDHIGGLLFSLLHSLIALFSSKGERFNKGLRIPLSSE
jgi:hypothetical protein